MSGLQLKDSENPNGDIEIVTTGLRPGEKLSLKEPYTLRKLDVMLEFIRGDRVTYPKVMDTKKYMTFHSMEEQIATFRVSRLRSWTLWKSENDDHRNCDAFSQWIRRNLLDSQSKSLHCL